MRIDLGTGIAATALVAWALAACGGGGGVSALPAPLEQRIAIDGHVDFADFATSTTRVVTLRDQIGTGAVVATSSLRWAIMHDDRDLYVACTWTDTTFNHADDLSDLDGVRLEIDDDGDGVHEVGEDRRALFAASVGSIYQDGHVTGADDADLVGDGVGALRYDAAARTYHAEFLFPLAADRSGEDAAIQGTTRYSLTLFDHLRPIAGTGNAGGAHRLTPDASDWPQMPLGTVSPTARPEIPAGLPGLVAFISDHDVAKGEVYTFDPIARQVTRVTTSASPTRRSGSPGRRLSWS